MSSYFIESFEIRNLWGYRDIHVQFHRDVNILIGPNGSGKTTILNLLHAILSSDLRSILEVKFGEAVIKLRGVTGNSVRTVRAKIDWEGRILKLSVGRTRINLDMDYILGRRGAGYHRHPETGQIVRRTQRNLPRGRIMQELTLDEFTGLVPIVWLPLSRLSMTEHEDEQNTKTGLLEAVDIRIRRLMEGLTHYYSGLNTRLSRRYKEFEHLVLSEILYRKEHDQLNPIRESVRPSLPTEAEKGTIVECFSGCWTLRRTDAG